MFGYSIDQILGAVNGLYIISLALTVVLSFVLWRLSSLSGKLKDERLAQYQLEAQVQISSATNQSEQARADAARANEYAANANLRAAEVEKQNIELRHKFANRRITEEQNRILVEELSKHKATFNMETMGDPESGIYAADILRTFTQAGWKVDKKEFPLGIIWTGLILFQSKDKTVFEIAEAFKKANIPFSFGDQWRDKATIMVGGKPPVF